MNLKDLNLAQMQQELTVSVNQPNLGKKPESQESSAERSSAGRWTLGGNSKDSVRSIQDKFEEKFRRLKAQKTKIKKKKST